MTMISSFDFLLEKLMETEISMSRLYYHFSVRFPEAADFWKLMSGEEEEHSKWIGEALNTIRAREKVLPFLPKHRLNLARPAGA
jgi:hypothetical protein